MEKYISFALIFAFSSLAAQEKYDITNIDNRGELINKYEKYYESGNRGSRGRKCTGRFLWHSQFRSGNPHNAKNYIHAAKQIEPDKHFSDSPLSSAQWSPVGPKDIARTYDTASGHGIGRINCVEFHPVDSNILWIGSPHGGLWKSINGGKSWFPKGDDLPVMAISDIKIDPNNPQVMYICTGDYGYVAVAGENSIYFNGFGLGVFKSVDGGDSWTPTSLNYNFLDFGYSIMRRVIIHPDDSDMLVAAGANGVFTSADAGESWENKFEKMIWDIDQDPVNPDILYAYTASVGYMEKSPKKIIKSTDFGNTWDTLDAGLPDKHVYRCEIDISPVDNNYIYVLASANDNGFSGLYRSTDAGKTWEKRSSRDSINILAWYDGTGWGGQAFYDLTLLCDAEDKDRIYAGGVNFWGSSDGGETWDIISHWTNYFGKSLHADQHYSEYNPLNKKYYICNDGGLYATKEIRIGSKDSSVVWMNRHTESPKPGAPKYHFPTQWENLNPGLAITEFYRMGLCKNHNNYVTAGSQDNSCFYNNSTEWINYVTNYDGMQTMIDHNNPEIIYGVWQRGGLCRSTDGGKTIRTHMADTIGQLHTERGAWVTPYQMHPDDPTVMFAGYGNVWKLTDRGEAWHKISDFDTIPGANYISSIIDLKVAESDPGYIYISKPREIYHGNQPGNIWRTSDGGGSWQNITAGLPADKAHFAAIEVHDDNPNIAWVGLSGFIDNNKIFKTSDGGNSWQNVSMNLPNIPVNTIAFYSGSDHDYIFAGLDIGVYYTHEDLDKWKPYSANLPNCIISDLKIHEKSERIYAATFGRGVWMASLPDKGNPVEETGQYPHLSVVPNPAGERFSIIGNDLTPGKAKLQIVAITGTIVQNRAININNPEYEYHTALNLDAGVYFARIISHDNTIYTAKFLVAE
jgi:photosystem II stability/assembly factor-like uncharacterized protein